MKVFFTGSTSKLKEDTSKYLYIINYLETLGHVNTNYIHYPENSDKRRSIEDEIIKKQVGVYDYSISLINSSDIVIADITTQSIKVGYQIDYALNKKIPTLVIYKKSKDFVLPIVLQHSHYGLLKTQEYKELEDLKIIIKNYLNNIKTGKIKFNLFINPEIYNYLTRRSLQEGRNKSDIIRDLILKEIKDKPLE